MVAFTDKHELFSTEEANGFHAWRFEGSAWMPPQGDDDDDGGGDGDGEQQRRRQQAAYNADADLAAAIHESMVSANALRSSPATSRAAAADLVFPADAKPAEMAATVVEQLMTSTIVPTFQRYAGKLDAATQRMLGAFLGDARVILTEKMADKLASLPAGTEFTAEHVHEMLGDLMGTLTAKWHEITGRG